MAYHPRPQLLLVLLVSPLPFMQGSSCIDLSQISNTIDRNVDKITETVNKSVDKVNQTVSTAVDQLGQQSTSWQGTLKTLESSLALDASNLESQAAQHASDLEKQLIGDIRGLIDQVDYIIKDGLQFTQEQFNCQNDIYNTHARIALKNALSAFLNKYKYKGIGDRPADPFLPIVCSANPNGINVAAWDSNNYLTLSGTDFNLFDTQKPSIVLVRPDNSEVTTPTNLGSRVTNYRYEVNVPVMISNGLLRDVVQLQVRWNGHKVNQNEMPVVPCGGSGRPCCRVGNACETGACVNGICGACGQAGQPCCAGSNCTDTTTVCSGGYCAACGSAGQPCCNGRTCTAGGTSCVNNQCTACGGAGQPCCNGVSCGGGMQCVSGTCAECGTSGHACCGTSCTASGSVCSGGMCSQCGGTNQLCCPGSTCNNSSNRCVSGICAECGDLNQSCCNGTTCYSGSCLSGICSYPGPVVTWAGGSSPIRNGIWSCEPTRFLTGLNGGALLCEARFGTPINEVGVFPTRVQYNGYVVDQCPDGYAMTGCCGGGQYNCAQVPGGYDSSRAFNDGTTQRFGTYACPDGNLMIGITATWKRCVPPNR